jgi:hypothetical protein
MKNRQVLYVSIKIALLPVHARVLSSIKDFGFLLVRLDLRKVSNPQICKNTKTCILKSTHIYSSHAHHQFRLLVYKCHFHRQLSSFLDLDKLKGVDKQ